MVAGGKLFALGSGLANTNASLEPSKQVAECFQLDRLLPHKPDAVRLFGIKS